MKMKILSSVVFIGFFAHVCLAKHECAKLALSTDDYSDEQFEIDFDAKRKEHLVWVTKDNNFNDLFELCSPFSYGTSCGGSYVEYGITKLVKEAGVITYNIYTQHASNADQFNLVVLGIAVDEDEKEEKYYIFKKKSSEVYASTGNAARPEISEDKLQQFSRNIDGSYALHYLDKEAGYSIYTSCKGPHSWVLVRSDVATDVTKLDKIKGHIEKRLRDLYSLKGMPESNFLPAQIALITANPDNIVKKFEGRANGLEVIKSE